jgi:hypothetical protein
MATKLKVGEYRLTIPYIAEDRSDSRNYGYFDLKANPELINSISEVQGWQEMADLLYAINSPLSHFKSLGCWNRSIGYTDENQPHLNVRLESYVDIAFVNMSFNSQDYNFDHVVSAMQKFVKNVTLSQFSNVDCELTPTLYIDQNIQGWCLSIWLDSFGSSENEARKIWSSAIGVLSEFFLTNWVPDFTDVG